MPSESSVRVMLEPSSGLPIASIAHLPRGLHDTLMRNQQGVAPVVLYAEWMHKLSDRALRRGTKERLVLITPDSINVFAPDGTVKRRIKIGDVSNVYVAMPTSPLLHNSEGLASSANGVSSSSRSAPASGPGPTVVGSVCIEVPRQFDAAFDVRRQDETQCRAAQMRLLRVLCTLHRATHNKPLAVMCLQPGCLSTEPHSELEYFRLKKAHAAGANPHGRKGPLLAPVLPLVTEEMERLGDEDVRSQLEQAIQDVTSEVRRYKEDHCAKPLERCIERVLVYTNRVQETERECHTVAQKRCHLSAKSTRQTEAMDALESAMSAARRTYVEEAQSLDQIRSEHNKEVACKRKAVEAAEQRMRQLRDEMDHTEASFLHTMRHHIDPERTNLEDALQCARDEYKWKYTSLPTAQELVNERSLLHTSLEQLRSAMEHHASQVAQLNAAEGLVAALQTENAELERGASDALVLLRGAKQTTAAKVAQVSMTIARRNKLARTLEERTQAVRTTRAKLDPMQGSLQALCDAERHHRHASDVQDLECIVSEDLERQTTMHQGLSQSVVQRAGTQRLAADHQEASLRSKLMALRTRGV